MEYHIIYVLSWRGEKGREKRSGMQVYNLLSSGCNTDYNKFGERMTEWENKNESSISVLMVQP